MSIMKRLSLEENHYLYLQATSKKMKTNKKNTLIGCQKEASKIHFPEKLEQAKEFLKKHPVPEWILNR